MTWWSAVCSSAPHSDATQGVTPHSWKEDLKHPTSAMIRLRRVHARRGRLKSVRDALRDGELEVDWCIVLFQLWVPLVVGPVWCIGYRCLKEREHSRRKWVSWLQSRQSLFAWSHSELIFSHLLPHIADNEVVAYGEDENGNINRQAGSESKCSIWLLEYIGRKYWKHKVHYPSIYCIFWHRHVSVM